MPFELIRNDLTRVKADALVNSANPEPVVGRGLDSAVFNAAGYEKLLAERKKIGSIKPGEAAVTKAFGLKAKYIIHTVGPVWIDGQHNELETLASCYRKSLRLAEALGCKSIALPLISTGVYRFPKDKALTIALREIETFCTDTDIDVMLVVYDRSSYEISESLNLKVRSFINDRIAAVPDYQAAPSMKDDRSAIIANSYAPRPGRKTESLPFFDHKEAAPQSVAEILKSKSETFQEKLLSLIDEKGLTDPEVYKKANMDRKLFSKIRSNPDYVPRKKNVFALAVALQLSYKETADLLSRAGYAFSPSTPFDLILEYCIRNKIYNTYDINSILFEYDQQLL